MNDERNSDGYRIGHETSMCPGMPLPGDVLCGAGFDSGTRASPGGRVSDATKAILPTAETDKILGLVCHSHEYMESTSYDSTATPPASS